MNDDAVWLFPVFLALAKTLSYSCKRKIAEWKYNRAAVELNTQYPQAVTSKGNKESVNVLLIFVLLHFYQDAKKRNKPTKTKKSTKTMSWIQTKKGFPFSSKGPLATQTFIHTALTGHMTMGASLIKPPMEQVGSARVHTHYRGPHTHVYVDPCLFYLARTQEEFKPLY